MESSAWVSGLTSAGKLGLGIATGVATGNPIPALYGAIDFSKWLFDRWQEASSEPSPARRPSASVPELINSASSSAPRSGWFQEAATEQVPTRRSDEAIAGRRAAEIARSDRAGTDFDNWIRAVIQLKIEQRAAEIARSPSAGTDFENWLRAERELKIAQRAEEIARSPAAGTDYDNWLRAEHEVDVAHRAGEIAHSRLAGSDVENWVLAERELKADRAAISQRAKEIASSAETTIEIRTRAEIMLRAEEIAKSSGTDADYDNWLRAESEVRAYHARLDECVQSIAASPEAALGHWLRAEQELRTQGRITTR